MVCPYHQYYYHQAGSGIGIIYKGAAHQRGHGIGSFLGGLFRAVLPLLKSGAKFVGKEALNAGVGVLSDMVNVRPLDESVKTRLKTLTSNIKRKADEKIDSVMSGSGYKIRKPNRKLITRKKVFQRRGSNTIRKQSDIFQN